MKPLAHDLDSDELAVANELIRSAIRLGYGHAPDRLAMIAAHAAGQIAGVSGAHMSIPVRSGDSKLLEINTSRAFDEAQTRAFLWAMAERAGDARSALCALSGVPVTPALPFGGEKP